MSSRKRVPLPARRPGAIAAFGVAALITIVCCGAENAYSQGLPIAHGPTSSGELASSSISHGVLSNDFSMAFGYGYYTYINGITGPMFSGPPSENTAIFTFKTSIATTFPLPQNIDEVPEVSSGATYDIYLNTAPNQNWADPNSFAKGLKVATFQRTGFILTGIGFAAFETFNSTLTFSQPFTYNGFTVDFKNFTPGLRTSNIFGRFAVPSGIPNFPSFLSFTGSAVATRLPSAASLSVPTAVAGPKGATVFTIQFTLDGTKSSSPDGKRLKYQWSLVPGSLTASIVNADTATPIVNFRNAGVYGFMLTVTNSTGQTATDTVNINFAGPGLF
jgi:hypothetical protein